MEYTSIENAMTIFFCCSIFGIFCDRFNLSSVELVLIVLSLVGVVLILRPGFIFGGWGQNHHVGQWGANGFTPNLNDL